MQPGTFTPGGKSFDLLAGLPIAERSAVLQTLHEGCPAFAAELENLLRAYDRRSGFLEVSAAAPQVADAAEPDLVGFGTRTVPHRPRDQPRWYGDCLRSRQG